MYDSNDNVDVILHDMATAQIQSISESEKQNYRLAHNYSHFRNYENSEQPVSF